MNKTITAALAAVSSALSLRDTETAELTITVDGSCADTQNPDNGEGKSGAAQSDGSGAVKKNEYETEEVREKIPNHFLGPPQVGRRRTWRTNRRLAN